MSENITIRDAIYGILKEMKPNEKTSFSDVIQNVLDENEMLRRENRRLLNENDEKGKNFFSNIIKR